MRNDVNIGGTDIQGTTKVKGSRNPKEEGFKKYLLVRGNGGT